MIRSIFKNIFVTQVFAGLILCFIAVFAISHPQLIFAQLEATESSEVESEAGNSQAEEAQEVEAVQADPEIQEVSRFIFEKEELKDEITEIKRTLNGQLAEYRVAEQDFLIKKGQFEQLNTLSSLEVAIQSTRSMMQKRTQVLQTYLTLIRLETLNVSGLRLEYREFILEENTRLENALTAHLEQIESSVDRASISATSDQFSEISPQVQDHITFSRQVLQLARYQSLYDSTAAIFDDLVEESNDTERESKVISTAQDQRALEQIEIALSRVEETLREADSGVTEYMTEERKRNRFSLTDNIEVAFGGMKQVFRFLDELVTNYR